MIHLFDSFKTVYSLAGGSFSAENFIHDQSVYARLSMNGPQKHDFFYWRTGVTNISYTPTQLNFNCSYDEPKPYLLSPNGNYIYVGAYRYVLPLIQCVFYQTETLAYLYQVALSIEADYQTETYNRICDLNNLIAELSGNSNTWEIHNWGLKYEKDLWVDCWGLRYEKNLWVDCLYESHEHSMNLILENHAAEYRTPNREPVAKIYSQTTLEEMRVMLSTAEEHLSHLHDYERPWRYAQFREDCSNMCEHL